MRLGRSEQQYKVNHLFVIFFIIMQSRTEIQESVRDFQSLIRQGGLPPKMQVKLRYLLNTIQGNEEDYSLVDDLPQFQKMSLHMMDKTTKVSLFNSIVKCLAGRQVLIYFSAEKATLKTESSSANSLTCYLFGTSQALKISKNKEATSLYYQMSMERLMVSKIYRQQKKKYSFGIQYEGVRYRIRFQEEGQCARIHGALLTIIREKRSMKTKHMHKENQSQTKREEAEDQFEINYEAKMLEQEKQYVLSLKKRVVQADLQNSQRFQLLKNTDWGKILANRKENQVCDVSNLIESYIQFGCWNTQVQSFRVINKIRRNTYLCSLILKRKALTASRQTFFTVSYFKDCGCLSQKKNEALQKQREKHYLLLNSVSSSQHLSTQKGTYPFSLNQIIQFSKVEGENSCVFINLKSKIDFNVYEYLTSSVDKSLDFLGEIVSINLLSKERELLKNNKKQLFQFNYCMCQTKISQKINFEQQTQVNSQLKKSITSDLQQSRKKPAQQSIAEMPLKDIFEVLDNHNNKNQIEKKMLDFIKKKVYQKYYLKQRFDLECHQQPYIDSQYHLKEIQNFFELGTAWKFNSSEDLIYIDEEILKMQKSALKLIIKQITSNLMAGKSILNMSLPVELFSDDSSLEGFAKIFGFVPYFMNEAVKHADVVEQIKYVAAAWFFIFACNPQVTKPFNPILGETYEGIIGGIRVYFQQISHHPPIAAFYMKNDKFQAYGNFDINVDLGMNSAFTKFPTAFTIKIFENNREYIIRYPDVEVGGIMFGNRTLKNFGKSYVLEKNSGTYLQLSIGKAKKGLYQYKQKIRQADLVGGIFQISPATIQRLQTMEKKKSVEGIKPQEAIKKYSVITGKWYGDLAFDGVTIKSFKDGPFPLKIQRPSILLPSDCCYRLDIIYKRWRDYKTSNEQKEVLENLQRKDRKARQKINPKKH